MLQAGSKLRSIAAGAKCKLKANSKLRSIAAGESIILLEHRCW